MYGMDIENINDSEETYDMNNQYDTGVYDDQEIRYSNDNHNILNPIRNYVSTDISNRRRIRDNRNYNDDDNNDDNDNNNDNNNTLNNEYNNDNTDNDNTINDSKLYTHNPVYPQHVLRPVWGARTGPQSESVTRVMMHLCGCLCCIHI
jgi:hypothetical protein